MSSFLIRIVSHLTTYSRNEIEPPSIPLPNETKSGSTALKNIQPPFSFYWRPRESNFEGLDAIIRQVNVVWGYNTLYVRNMVL